MLNDVNSETSEFMLVNGEERSMVVDSGLFFGRKSHGLLSQIDQG